MAAPINTKTPPKDVVPELSYTIDELVVAGLQNNPNYPAEEVPQDENTLDELEVFLSGFVGSDQRLDHLDLHAAVDDSQFEFLFSQFERQFSDEHAVRDAVFTNIFALYGESAEALLAKNCEINFSDEPQEVLLAYKTNNQFKINLETLVQFWTEQKVDCGIPLPELTKISPLLTWQKNEYDGTEGLVMSVGIYALTFEQQEQLVAAVNTVVLKYVNKAAARKEPNEIKKLYYEGFAALYSGHIELAKASFLQFLQLLVLTPDEVTLSMYEMASQTLRHLELDYLEAMRQQVYALYAERVAVNWGEAKYAHYRDDALVLIAKLEKHLRSGEANTVVEAMELERFAFEQALSNQDVKLNVERGWVVRNPYPMPAYGTPEYSRITEAAEKVLTETKNPVEIHNVDVPTVRLSGGTIDIPQYISQGYPPFLLKVVIGPEGGTIFLDQQAYVFQPSTEDRVVAIRGFTLIPGKLTWRDYTTGFRDRIYATDILSTNAKKQDPVFQRLLALNTPEAWQISSDKQGKDTLGVIAARELADQGSIDSATVILEGILEDAFIQVAKTFDASVLESIRAKCNTERFTKDLIATVTQSLESFRSQSNEDFLKKFPNGWPTGDQFNAMVEQQRHTYIAAQFGIKIWDFMAMMVRAETLKLPPIQMEAFKLLDNLIGLNSNSPFPSEKTVGQLTHMFAEEAAWFLPTLAVSLGVGTVARIGMRAIPFVAEQLMVGGATEMAFNTMIYGASSLLEGAVTDGLAYVWTDGADPIRMTDIAYYGVMNLAFHGVGVASQGVAIRVGLGPDEIKRMPSMISRFNAQSKVFAGSVAAQATMMTLTTEMFEPQARLGNDNGFAGNWLVNLARASMNTAGQSAVGKVSRNTLGVDPFEMEQRSLMRSRHAQATYQVLTEMYPLLDRQTRMASALREAEFVVPSSLTFLPLQRGLTVEQEVALRQMGLKVLLDRWSGAAQDTAIEFLTLSERYAKLQESLESQDSLATKEDALSLIIEMESLGLITLGKAKGIYTNDGTQMQQGHARGVEMAYEAKRQHEIDPNSQTQQYSVALALDMTQGNSVNKDAMTSIKRALALLVREYFGEGPLLYSEPMGAKAGETTISNHVILQLQLGNVDRVLPFMGDVPTFLKQMIVEQQGLKQDLLRAISVAQTEMVKSEQFGRDSQQYILAKTNFDVAVGRLSLLEATLKDFRVLNGQLQVRGVSGKGEEWFDLSRFELRMNGAVEPLNMSTIYQAKNESYIHAEVHRARNAAIFKAEFMQSKNRGVDGLTTAARLMVNEKVGDQYVNIENFTPRYLFPEGQYLNVDDIAQNLMRLFDNRTAQLRLPNADSMMVTTITQLNCIEETLVVRVLQLAGQSREPKVTPKQIYDCLKIAEQIALNSTEGVWSDRVEIARTAEFAKMGLDYMACDKLGRAWYRTLRTEMTSLRLNTDSPLLDSLELRTPERSALYRDFKFENLSPEAQMIVMNLQDAFAGPLNSEGIALYRAFGGIVEPGRTLRYIYDGTGSKSNDTPGLFAQIDDLKARLAKSPQAPLSEDDRVLLQRLARTNLVAVDFIQKAAFDSRDRVTRPWALYSQATLTTIQRHYRLMQENGHADAVESPGFYQFGLEIAHAKDREAKVAWDDSFYFDPSMIPIRQLNTSVAEYLSQKRGATVALEAFALGDEMVASVAKHDSLGRLIPLAEIAQAYHDIIIRDFPLKFNYTEKVVTQLGDPAKGRPDTIQRLPKYQLNTSKGQFIIAVGQQARQNSYGESVMVEIYYLIQEPGVPKADPTKVVPEIVNYADFFVDTKRFGIEPTLEEIGQDLRLGPLVRIEGLLEIRVTDLTYQFSSDEMFGDAPLADSQALRQMLDTSALSLMQYDETIKKQSDATVGSHSLSAGFIDPIRTAFPQYANYIH